MTADGMPTNDAELLVHADKVLKLHAEFERRYLELDGEMAAARAMPLDTDEQRLARYTRRAEVNNAMADLLTAKAQSVEPGSLIAWGLLLAADVHRERADSAQDRADSVRARIDKAAGGGA